MKTLQNILIVFFVTLLACGKEDCVTSEVATCKEIPPENELCDAYFEKWFFNSDLNACEFIPYSGCSQRGFETQNECEACKCD